MATIVDISEVLLELGLSASETEEERAVTLAAIVKAESAVKRYLKYDPVSASRTEFYPAGDKFRPSQSGVWQVQGGQAMLQFRNQGFSDELIVKHLPVRDAPAIDLRIDSDGRFGTLANAFAATSQKTIGSDFWLNFDSQDSSGNGVCLDGIFRSFGLWSTEPGSVKIVYTAGYTAAELHGQDVSSTGADTIDASQILHAVIDEAVRYAKKVLVNKKSAAFGFMAGPLESERLGDYSYKVSGMALNNLFGSKWDLMPETQGMLQDYLNYGWSLAG